MSIFVAVMLGSMLGTLVSSASLYGLSEYLIRRKRKQVLKRVDDLADRLFAASYAGLEGRPRIPTPNAPKPDGTN